MIAYLPDIYEDELMYSYLSRINEHSGFISFKHCAKEIYKNPDCHVDIEFINAFSPSFLLLLEKNKPFKSYIAENTLFPYYARFLKYNRRNKAQNSLINQTTEYANLLTKPKNKGTRYLRYCPICISEDRKKYGEAYFHRSHQLLGVDICWIHDCYLKDTAIIIKSTTTPNLKSLETENPTSSYEICYNETELKLAKYIVEVINRRIVNSKADIGDVLRSKIIGTKYSSARGKAINNSLLAEDISKYYKDIKDSKFEAWKIQKIISSDSIHTVDICKIAMFFNISPVFLTAMKIYNPHHTDDYDKAIERLHNSGMTYKEISNTIGGSIDYIKFINRKINNTH